MIKTKRLAGLHSQAQQLRFVAKADVKQDMKTRARKEDVTVDRKFGDISSARVDDDPMSRTSFGDSAKPSAPEKISATFWLTKAPKRRRHGSHPWRCARQHPPVAYCTPAQPL